MTRSCPYCSDVVAAEKFDDHLKDCIDAAHVDPPAPPGRFLVTCSNLDCLLHKGVPYSDIGNAELLAWAHENRWRELGGRGIHSCNVTEFVKDQTSLAPESATGTKEAARG